MSYHFLPTASMADTPAFMTAEPSVTPERESLGHYVETSQSSH